ncbi:MAG: phosphorylase family protein [Bacteroides sp.]
MLGESLLIVSATLGELTQFLEQYLSVGEKERLKDLLSNPKFMGFMNLRPRVDCCITGVGVASVCMQMAQLPLKGYSFVLGVGFVGSYAEEFAIGQVVQITEDKLADYGLWKAGKFRSLTEINLPTVLGGDGSFVQASTFFLANYPCVRALTFSYPTGDVLCKRERLDKYKEGMVESMESAAFSLVCSNLQIKEYLSLRVVSNYVRRREQAQWNVPLAQANLAEAILEVLYTR